MEHTYAQELGGHIIKRLPECVSVCACVYACIGGKGMGPKNYSFLDWPNLVPDLNLR